jgi:DNA-binding Lrp family transcriptional regulator
VIRKYVTLLDPIAVNLSVTVFVQITLDLQVEGRLEIFERAVMNRPEVLECYLMTGDADYLLRVVVPDVPSYERFLRDALTKIESVAGINSSFSLKQVKYFTALPLTGEGSKLGGAIVREPLRSKADAPARRRRIPRKEESRPRSA